MNVVDSSGWLEYFADAKNADFFAGSIEASATLIVPTISLYEVFKHILRERSRRKASQAVAYMQQGKVVALNAELAVRAAATSHEEKLPMADSLILETARAHEATLWTQDADFEDIEGVRFVPKTTA